MFRPSHYLNGALAAIAVLFGFAGQIGDNLVYLAGRDLEKERHRHMAEKTAFDTELEQVQGEVSQIVPLIQNLIADDVTQIARGDALQAAIKALQAQNPDDTARIAILDDMKANLDPLLAALTPATPVPPLVLEPPVVPVSPVGTEPASPEGTDTASPVGTVPTPTETSSALQSVDGSAPAGSDAAAQINAAASVAVGAEASDA